MAKGMSISFKNGLAYYGCPGRSRISVATVLGHEVLPDGCVRVWLDRLIHTPKVEKLGEWWVSGGYTTILAGRPELFADTRL